MAQDPYSLLGVTKDASDADIKSAYRKLAKKYHPDLNPGKIDAKQKFNDIGTAYSLLSDKDKRAAFDRGEIDAEGQPKRPHNYYSDHASGPTGSRYYKFNQGNDDPFKSKAEGGQFEDIFGSFFSRGGQGFEEQQWPREQRYTINVEFLEAAKGGNTRVTLPDGRVLDIKIPEGIQSGQQLRLKDQGGTTPDGQAADALVEVRVKPHPFFTRKNNDIYSDLTIGFHESILARKVPVQTINGLSEVTIPKGASSGAKLRLKGKGIKQGDHYLNLKITMPPTVDPELEKLVKDWADKHHYNPRGKEKIDVAY